MPTTNPRMQITVKPETKRVFEEAADLLGIPASRLVTQVLEEAQDSIFQMAEAIRLAKSDPVKGLIGLKDLVVSGRQDASDAQVDIEEQISKRKRARKSTPKAH